MPRPASRMAFFALVCLLALGAVVAGGGSQPSRKERLADLPVEERAWLTEYVAPIILPAEEKLFLELTQPHERERFKREFWARREKEDQSRPMGPGYEARYGELRRLADEVYDGWRNDAGRMVMHHGEPAEIRKVRTCEHVFRDLEIWTYPGGVQGVGLFLFYRFDELQPRKLWDLNTPEREIFARDSCRQSFAELFMDCPGSFVIGDKCKGPVCPEACDVYQIYRSIRARQHNALGASQERAQVLQSPQVSLEGIERIRDVSATAVAPNARPLSVTGPSETVPAPPSAPARKASKKELLDALPDDERIWLTEFVAPIILPEEGKLFLELTADYQRELFKKDFWARRERDGLPAPFGPGYERRYQHLREVAAADYDGIDSDAGRMVVRLGEPASIRELLQCSEVYRQAEIWSYPNPAGSSSTETHHVFYRPFFGVPRRLWIPGDPGIFQTASCLTSFDQACAQNAATGAPPTARDAFCPSGALPRTCPDACMVATIADQTRVGEALLIQRAPEISTEGLDQLRKKFATLSEPNAKPLSVTGPSETVPAPKPAPARKVSKKELLDALPDDERVWLTEYVAPIILPEEEKLFLDLTAGYQWEIFKREFWARRERVGLARPFGPGFERRYEELRPRLDSVYDGWRNDAGRMVLHYGEPNDIHHVQGCDDVFRDLEIWTYENLGEARQKIHHLFYRVAPSAPRMLWIRRMDALDSPESKRNANIYSEVFVPLSCRPNFDSLVADCILALGDKCRAPVCAEACDVYRVYQEVMVRQGSATGAMIESARVFGLPDISTEGLDALRNRFPASANPNAKPLSVAGPFSSGRRPEPAPTPEPRHWLTTEEMRERILKLEPKYRQWLEMAGPLLNFDDLSRFLQLAPREKDKFIRDFWRLHK